MQSSFVIDHSFSASKVQHNDTNIEVHLLLLCPTSKIGPLSLMKGCCTLTYIHGTNLCSSLPKQLFVVFAHPGAL